MNSQTIVAPMTPAGVSAVAAIRVSGPAVREVVRALFGARAEESLEARRANLATARDPRTVKNGDFKSAEVLDSLLYIYFEAPNSYTGEDVLELYPHGNPLIVRDLMQAIRSVPGVRLAEPGEYTRRAFLNGKMDLAQAESVADVIHSANRAELKNAHRLLSGALSKKVAALTAQIKDISARLELDVDFAEEEADPDYATWSVKIAAIRESVESILKSFRGKASVSRIPMAVLYGAPNAGKSSLVNALLGEDRILVSNIPGTTRDFVEVRLFLAGGEIRLVDTAGIAAKATDALDALSMEKSREILAEADLKILVIDGAAPGEPLEGVADCASDGGLTAGADLVVYSKRDLSSRHSDLPESVRLDSRLSGCVDPVGGVAPSRMTQGESSPWSEATGSRMTQGESSPWSEATGSRMTQGESSPWSEATGPRMTQGESSPWSEATGSRMTQGESSPWSEATGSRKTQGESSPWSEATGSRMTQDESSPWSEATGSRKTQDESSPWSEATGSRMLRVSAKTGEGLDELTRIMNERLFAKLNDGEDLWITSEREKTCLEEALTGIDRALELIRTNPAVELLAFEMQLVRRSLQSIVGEISSEDVLQSIFAGFCIGK